MRQRQPDRADLLPAGRDAVEDAAADDEVAARVVVAEREAEMRVVQGDEGAADEKRLSQARRAVERALRALGGEPEL